ncbi:cytidylyltransferase domain-containing protein [Pseudoalteromonas sp. DY56-GL79]|uniref:acylneuraminate cytidylyltransferase family protein n=1 Tax=Pseudoalteromonas sp. DY56-GL79 TaxID=2967131 RepID=UPI00352BCF8D
MIAIIPARGGSKGLPRKNIRLLNGKPMIAYTIEAALASEHISKVIVSTDDVEIYNIGLESGAEDTFLRPSELAQDDSRAIDNYLYTLERLGREYNCNIDSFIVLQPTSPLRSTKDIDEAIQLFKNKNADSVISYCEESHPIFWHKYLKDDGRLENIFPDNIDNRQALKPSYYPNGAIFIFTHSLLLEGKYYSDNTFAYLMPRSRSVDIDTIDDFMYAEYLMGRDNA